MGLSVSNILLQITGDAGDARRELADTAADLAVFGRETAEAEADVDTTGAQAHLDELKAKLASISAEDVTADVNVSIASAQADIAVLQAELDHLDGQDVNVDVNVRRGVVNRITSLAGDIERLGQSAENVSQGGLTSLLTKFEESSTEGQGLMGVLTRFPEVIPAAIAAIVAIVGDLAALVASAASAVEGLGALAVAFGAVLVPGVLLGIGAIARFKDTAGTAGTAAHKLSEAFSGFSDVFKNATGKGADAVFRGLATALEDLEPLVKSLGPAFTRLGKAGGDAFRSLGKEFSSKAWRNFFQFATDSLTKLTPLFTRSFGAFADILRNIARAAMPFLIAGFRQLAHWLEAIADKTSNIHALRGAIGGMVHSLEAMGHLLGGLADLAQAFVEAFAPFGDSIAESLGDGAHHLAEWLRSSEGLRKVKQFFEDTGPLAAELGKLVLQIALAFIQLGQFVAPAITPIVRGFNQVFEALNKALSWLNDKIPNGVRAAAGTLTFLLVGFGKLRIGIDLVGGAARVVIALLGTMGGAFGKVGDSVKGAFEDAADFAGEIGAKVGNALANGISSAASAVASVARDVVRGAIKAFSSEISTARDIGSNVIDAVKHGFNASRSAVVEVARAIVKAVLSAIRDAISRAGNIGRSVFNAVKGGFNDVRGAVVGAARDIIQAVLGALRDAIDTARNIGNSIITALKGGFNAARSAVIGAIDEIRTGVLEKLRDGIALAKAAGESLVQAIARGISAAASAIYHAIESIFDKIKGILETPIKLHIDLSSIPGALKDAIPGLAVGARDFSGGLVEVGEMGRELMFVPQGADVYTASETRRILRALADGVARPAGASGAPVLAGVGNGGGGTTIVNNITPIAGGGSPDPEALAAQLSAKLRARQGT